MKVVNPERMYVDESGAWWYVKPDSKRQRARVSTCEACGEGFVAYPSSQGRFCSRQCAAPIIHKNNRYPVAGKGPASHRWKGGQRLTREGYVELWMPDHPSLQGTKRKYIRRNRWVMEQTLGRPLLPYETVHHKNGDRQDDRPENLELWTVAHPYGQRAKEKPHCPTCTCFDH